MRDAAVVAHTLRGVDKLVHLAAEVSASGRACMLDRSVSLDDLDTAVLFLALLDKPVTRVVVASSTSVHALDRTDSGAFVDDVCGCPDNAGSSRAWLKGRRPTVADRQPARLGARAGA